MQVIQVAVKIVFVAQTVLVKARLPNGFSAVGFDGSGNPPGKRGFHHLPASGKIDVVQGQTPYAMQMVRQNHRRQQIERPFVFNLPKSLPKQIYPLFIGKNRLAAISHHGEKISPAWNI